MVTFDLVKASNHNAHSHDPGSLSIGFSGNLYYRGQQVCHHNTIWDKIPQNLYYSYIKRCYMSDRGYEVDEEDVKKSLDSMESLFQSMPLGWDPLKPHLFEGREVCDKRGQPLILVTDFMLLTFCHLKVVDSCNRTLGLPQIRELCHLKFGRLEVKDGKGYYRGRMIPNFDNISIYKRFSGFIDINFKGKSIDRHHRLDQIFCEADLEQLREIVGGNDIEGFKSVLDVYPYEWQIESTGIYQGRFTYKELLTEFFDLCPSQKLVDLFIQKHPEETNKFVENFSLEHFKFPDTIINSPMMDLRVLVIKAIQYDDSTFIRRLTEIRSPKPTILEALELDDARLHVICECLDHFDTSQASIFAILRQKAIDNNQGEVMQRFRNLLKEIWLELIPIYVIEREDLLKVIWEATRGMNRQQCQNFAYSFAECVSTLRMVAQFGIPNDIIIEIALKHRT